jgi:glutaredoxin
MGLLDRVRARAFGVIERVPSLARVNEALGRPLADAAEIAERREFAARGTKPSPSPSTSPSTVQSDAPPIIVYHMDKTRRDAQRLVEMLEAEGIPHRVLNIQEDQAAQMAVRRDSKGFRLPVVFVAGDAIGGRAELANLISSKKLTAK